jgi:hypothetical protein
MLEQNIEQKTPKNTKKNYCRSCNFVCSRQSEWNRHVSTSKHKNRTILNDLEQNIEQKTPKNTKPYMCSCGKSYSARNSLWYHKQKNLPTCNIKKDPEKTPLHEHVVDYNIENYTSDTELVTTLISTITKFNLDHQDTFMKVLKEIIPNVGHITNNTTNTNSNNNINNNFNIQMFLNDKCKNAMNLTDFIETLPITSATYDNTIENGLTKTITNLFVDGLNNMDILERPIHCTDAARKTLYIKNNDVWGKDNNLKTIENSITKVATKQRTMISKWQDANSGWNIDDNLQTKMTNLVCNSMTLIEQDEKETNKIIRAISKQTHLTQNVKEEYK